MYEPMPDVVNVPSCSRCARAVLVVVLERSGCGAGAVVYLCGDGPLEKLALAQPDGRADARRAGVTALVLFVVTAALAVLLVVRYHLTGPTVAVAILGGVPTLAALYLAWAALPGAIIPPESAAVKSRPMAAWQGGGIRWSWACTR